MNMEPVESSNVKEVGYDPETRVMRVTFRSGASHEYDDVEPDEHAGLVAAPSVGSHFHQHFRGRASRKL